MKQAWRRARSDSTEGFGLVEAVVSMLILALIAAGLAPILLQAILVMGNNSRLAMANQLLNQQIDQMHATVSTCSSLLYLINDAPAQLSVTPDGVFLQSRVSATDWPDCFAPSYPAAYKVNVTVTRVDTAAVVSSAVALVAVSGD